jgi:hypothetical protein
MKVGTPFRQLDILDHGPRSLTLPECTVNVQKLKLWGDESEFDGQSHTQPSAVKNQPCIPTNTAQAKGQGRYDFIHMNYTCHHGR